MVQSCGGGGGRPSDGIQQAAALQIASIICSESLWRLEPAALGRPAASCPSLASLIDHDHDQVDQMITNKRASPGNDCQREAAARWKRQLVSLQTGWLAGWLRDDSSESRQDNIHRYKS